MAWKIDPEGGLRAAFGMLAPAALVFAVRAALVLAGRDPADVPGITPLTIASGALSLLGVVLAVWVSWDGPDRWAVALPAAVIVLGHYVVRPFLGDFGQDLGAAMVYWGTAAIAATRVRPVVWAGLAAAIGALLRGTPDTVDMGEALIVVGAGITGIVLTLLAAGVLGRRTAEASVTGS